eukprot:RCo055240
MRLKLLKALLWLSLCSALVTLLATVGVVWQRREVRKSSSESGRAEHGREPEVCFLCVGDWGMPLPQTKALARSMGIYAELNQASFVVSTGDNFYMRGVSGPDDPLFRTNFEEVFSHPALQRIRWYISLGNHDQTRGTRGQILYTNRSTRWFLPSNWYSAHISVGSIPLIDLFILDHYHQQDGRYTVFPTQIPWLSRELGNSTALWKFVVDHRPVFSGGELHGSSPRLQRALLPLLRQYGVQLVLSGDDHILEVLQHLGITFVVSGGGSWLHRHKNVPETVFAAASNGFTAHHVNRTHMKIHVISGAGQILFSTEVPRTPT